VHSHHQVHLERKYPLAVQEEGGGISHAWNMKEQNHEAQSTRQSHSHIAEEVRSPMSSLEGLGHNVIMVGDVRAASAAAVYARAIEILLKGAPHRSFHLLRPRTAAAPQAPRHPETTVMGFADRCKAVPRP